MSWMRAIGLRRLAEGALCNTVFPPRFGFTCRLCAAFVGRSGVGLCCERLGSAVHEGTSILGV